MATITVEEAQARLSELIAQLQPGDEIVIVRDQKPIARLTATPEVPVPPRKLGTLKGSVLYMAPDFNAPLEDFKEYLLALALRFGLAGPTL